MKLCILNGDNMRSRREAHDEIARSLELPSFYGGNLDALWDVASSFSGEVILRKPSAMLNALGVYGCKMLQTLFEAADENPRLQFIIEDGE